MLISDGGAGLALVRGSVRGSLRKRRKGRVAGWNIKQWSMRHGLGDKTHYFAIVRQSGTVRDAWRMLDSVCP
jgi:hypothetical protein